MQDYEEALKKRRHDEMIKSAEKAALVAGPMGGMLGALEHLVHGARSPRDIIGRGLGTAVTSAAGAAGASLLGDQLLGGDTPDSSPSHAVRNAAGGGMGGALLGGGLGYLLGRGRLAGLAKLPFAAKAAEVGKKALPLDNLIVDYVKKQALNPSHSAGLRTALLLGGLGGGYGALTGASEGSEVDALTNHHGEDDNEADPRLLRRRAQY